MALSVFTWASAEESAQTQPEPTEAAFIKDGVLDLEAAIDHFEDLYRSQSSYAEVQFTVTRPKRTMQMRMKAWTQGKDRTLIVIEEPPREKGTATLKVDQNLWNFLPRINRTIRIPPSMMLASWMGSDFTNDDLVRESSLLEDYAYSLAGRSEDPVGWLIRFEAKPGVAGLWNRFELVLSDDGQTPLRGRYYDRKDRHARTMYWEDMKEFDGRRLPARMTLIPEDEPGSKTEMLYEHVDFDVEIPDDTFSLSALEQRR